MVGLVLFCFVPRVTVFCMVLREILLQTLPFHVIGFKICQLPLFSIVSSSSSWWQDNDGLKKLV